MRKGTEVESSVVTSVDRTNLECTQGVLMKRSHHGKWQKRFFAVNNQFLNYYSSKKMKDLRASCDLSTLSEDPALMGRFGDFLLTFQTGELRLKARSAANAEAWVKSLSARRTYFTTGPGAEEIELDGAKSTSVVGDLTGKRESKSEGREGRKGRGSHPKIVHAGSEAMDQDLERDDVENKRLVTKRSISKRKLKMTTRKGTVRTRNLEWEAKAREAIVKEGWLLKKSPSRFKAWQSRYFRLLDGSLYYYKNDKVSLSNFQGRIAVDLKCEVVLPEEDGDEELSGELNVISHFRTYELKAESSAVMKEWLVAVEKHKVLMEQMKKDHLEQVQKSVDDDDDDEHSGAENAGSSDADPSGEGCALAEKKLPAWLEEWDSCDESENLQRVQGNLNAKFQGCEENLDATLASATGLIEELDELSCDCLEEHGRPDVLTFYIRCYHVRFEHEIGSFLCGDQFEALSIHDMLRLMDLITAYGEFLSKLLSGEHGERFRQQLPPFSMEDNVEKMAARYLYELQESLATWVENIISSNFSRGDQCVEVMGHDSTSLVTSAPVDVFNMINETLAMAKASGVEQVQGAVLSCCLVTVAEYVSNLVLDLRRSERGRMLAKDLRFLCAVTNDCSVIMKHLDDLEKSEFGARSEDFGVMWDPVRVKYDQSAVMLMDLIIEMIQADLDPLMDMLFTPAHLRVAKGDFAANVALRIAATLQDYLEDIQQYLMPLYFSKCLKMLARGVIVRYVVCLMKLTPVWAAPATFVDEILPDKITYSTLNQYSSLTERGSTKLSMGDNCHIEADRNVIVATLDLFVPDANAFFANELVLLANVRDLLFVSPELFPSAVVKMCTDQPRLVQRPVVATAVACLSLRKDVTPAQASEIRFSISTNLREAALADKFKVEGSVSTARSTVYPQVWPDLVISTQISSQFKSLIKTARKNMANTPPRRHSAAVAESKAAMERSISRRVPRDGGDSDSPEAQGASDAKSADVEDAKVPSKALAHPSRRISVSAARSGRLQSPRLMQAVSVDISDEAMLKRKQQRKEKLDVTEDIRDVDLHGYLEKQGPRAPYPWQRRWFLVHKAFDETSRQWKLALSWHKSHNAPVKGRVFLEQLRKIELVANIPVRLGADGTSLMLDKASMTKNVSTDGRYEFRVVTKERVFSFRATSMSETVTWVNGLNKASREAKRMLKVLARAPSSRVERLANAPKLNYDELSMPELRSLCSAKGHKVNQDMARQLLIQLLQATEEQTVDKHEAAEHADLEEKKKLLLSRAIADLQRDCQDLGLDTSECVDKNDFATLLANAENNRVSPEEKEAHLRQLVARGLALLEEEDEALGEELEETSVAVQPSSNLENAIGIFERVAREAHEASFGLIEARAMHGLASAYSFSDDRRAAAPMMFEMASNMFWTAGEKSDAQSCVVDASEMYRIDSQYEDAIRCLVEFDTKSKSLIFSDKIHLLRLELHRKTNPPSRLSRFASILGISSSSSRDL